MYINIPIIASQVDYTLQHRTASVSRSTEIQEYTIKKFCSASNHKNRSHQRNSHFYRGLTPTRTKNGRHYVNISRYNNNKRITHHTRNQCASMSRTSTRSDIVIRIKEKILFG